jgi:hypothetical protein
MEVYPRATKKDVAQKNKHLMGVEMQQAKIAYEGRDGPIWRRRKMVMVEAITDVISQECA